MKLIIVESPTKARTLSRFLGTDYQIEATMGHVRDLPPSKMGIEIIESSNNKVPGYNFKPDYILMPKKKETIDKIKEEAKKADQIILATDPDREGEAIAWHVAHILKVPKTSDTFFQRIVFHEITKSAIKEALLHPRGVDMNLVDAQQARRVLDRLVGYKLSPLLWRKIRRGLSAGRVQSVTVRLIVEREREIEAFKPEEYWKIEAELTPQRHPERSPAPSGAGRVEGSLANASPNKSGDSSPSAQNDNKPQSFVAILISKNEKKVEIKNKEEADQILAELQNLTYKPRISPRLERGLVAERSAAFKVKNIEVKDANKYPYPPFTTSTMQQAASNLFGWTSKRTMQVAQSLYEEGLITYHRTDSFNLAQQAVTACRDFIKSEYGVNYVPEQPKFYKTKSKVVQEAHEAIRVTKVEVRSDLPAEASAQAGKLETGRDEKKLYELIWKRFVACQMKEAIYEETKVDILAGDTYIFRANGSKLKFDGWKRIYGEDGETENQLPPLEYDELLKLIQLLLSQHFTEPPARYTEATLIKALEEKGIGRPSTYAPIISTIQERQYVEKVERKFAPTVLGTTVSDFLVKNFTGIVDVDFTAKMEDQLDAIANGRMKWMPVLSEFYGPFNMTLEKVQEKAKRVKVPVEETDEKCEQCGAPLVIRLGRFGKFLACSKFPECKFTKSYVNKTGMTCPKCGGEIVIKKTKRGKQFYGCSNYPKCDFAAWRKDQIQKTQAS